ncbi:MAG: response regulator [Nitrospinota bacterium]
MPKILVVDDEPGVVVFLREFLAHRGYGVAVAYDGAEALRRVREDPPHLMLLDVRMPGLDGLEVLQRAKALRPQLGIIMVTAAHDVEIAKEAIRLGADDYITKPIDLGYLEISVLAKTLNRLGS